MIKYSRDLRKHMLVGIEALANAVGVTLGPRGRNVCLEKAFGPPTVTKDGVSVAKEIELSDPWENMGAQMIRDAASKTSDDAGDGTTTATVLARFLCRDGLRLIEAGMAPVPVKRGMDKAREVIVEQLVSASVPVNTQDQIAQVATISANGDATVGKLLAEAVALVGKDGVINIEEGQAATTVTETTDGMKLDRGWAHPEFCADEARQETVLRNVHVMVSDMPFAAAAEIVEKVLTPIVQEKECLLVLAADFAGNAIPTFVMNKRNGQLESCLVKLPGFGIQQDAIAQDIATLTGATLLSKHLGSKYEDMDMSYLGRAESVRITAKETIIVGGEGDPEEIEKRANQIRGEIARTASEFDADKLRDRLGRLLGGVCVIKVGAHTELEMREVKARLEDALYATKASLSEGIVLGGGTALIRAAALASSLLEEKQEEVQEGETWGRAILAEFNCNPVGPEEEAGFRLVLKACEEPLRYIVANAGGRGDVWVERVQNAGIEEGLDAAAMVMCNLFEAGVVDPLKVTRSAITNAVSIASTFLTSEAGINKPVKAGGPRSLL